MLENESITTINKLKWQVAELKLQLKQQSKYSSIIGTTFGCYLWKAAQVPVVVDMILQEVIVRFYNELKNVVLIKIDIFNVLGQNNKHG